MSLFLRSIPTVTLTLQAPVSAPPTLPQFVPSALALTVAGIALCGTLIVLFANRRSDLDQKYRPRIVEAKAKIRARRYYPELRRLLEDLAQEISSHPHDTDSKLSDEEFEATVGTAEVARRIAILNGFLSEENQFIESLGVLKDHQTRMLQRLVLALGCFAVGGIGLLTAPGWPADWNLTLGGIYATVAVGVLGIVGWTFFGQLRVESRLDKDLTRIENQE